jgi:hypothetical protein
MQSLLALSAAHLTLTNSTNLLPTSIAHRGLALKRLNEALDTPPTSAAESDAILATCLALSFGTSYLGQSIEEFLTLFRGCMLISRQEWRRKYDTLFDGLGISNQLKVIEPRLENVPLIDAALIREAAESLENIKHLCVEATNLEVYQYLVDVIGLLGVSSLQGLSLPFRIFQSPCNVFYYSRN